jgi:hypothetical protein
MGHGKARADMLLWPWQCAASAAEAKEDVP